MLGIAQRHTSDKEAVLATPSVRRESGTVRMRDGVAVISVMGPIFPRADFFTEISGATSIERLALLFGEALAADDVVLKPAKSATIDYANAKAMPLPTATKTSAMFTAGVAVGATHAIDWPRTPA